MKDDAPSRGSLWWLGPTQASSLLVSKRAIATRGRSARDRISLFARLTTMEGRGALSSLPLNTEITHASKHGRLLYQDHRLSCSAGRYRCRDSRRGPTDDHHIIGLGIRCAGLRKILDGFYWNVGERQQGDDDG